MTIGHITFLTKRFMLHIIRHDSCQEETVPHSLSKNRAPLGPEWVQVGDWWLWEFCSAEP